jgi:hypothetical protein
MEQKLFRFFLNLCGCLFGFRFFLVLPGFSCFSLAGAEHSQKKNRQQDTDAFHNPAKIVLVFSSKQSARLFSPSSLNQRGFRG